MSADSQIRRIESPSELRVEWVNTEVRQDRFLFWFLVVFWLVWAPVTIWATIMFLRGGLPLGFLIWAIGGWAVTLLMPYALLHRYWREWVKITPQSLMHGHEGLLAPKPKEIPLSAISDITIGQSYDIFDQSSRESIVSLNVNFMNSRNRKVRRILGYWLHPTLKEEVFRDLQEFATKHGLSLSFHRS